jgi:hypothetical protein
MGLRAELDLVMKRKKSCSYGSVYTELVLDGNREYFSS